ncbi:hypothetical protein MPTK1_5g13180 [Marchantia polymorpha subsp. ruderalis]|uniref:Uncharacterized protein n=2 Tax=Marchantia polymorpha TaxID=3197 RepID=A0AAF6BHV4_MARPO|nr:hypothetical protein MARPO_0032s0012 [Marchantia polymorpha]BBN11588.1 hypothetical protein Mp_5g13180 [Marchantia polymorpha subsp. ruderalis]|eukprot:PTQ41803.1 hypothetical protein MARPO_0032s0012 [Marchantia polymorpha]
MAMATLRVQSGGFSSVLSSSSVRLLRSQCVRRVAVQQLRIHARTEFSIESPYGPQVADAVKALRPEFEDVDTLVAVNLNRVIKAYANARVGSHHFSGTTGYGHNDAGGREALDQAFAEIVGAEAAIVRSQFFSGTHAIACALYAALRPGGELLAVAGAPYDTLEEVIGLRGSAGEGSLKEFGVSYREVPLAEDGGLDWHKLSQAVKPETQCALIQRSCGYSWRKTLTVAEIQRAIELIKAQNPDCVIVVDNCYGEFVEAIEPTAVGADLMAGSLIKNPGGTIAPCGGYVAGKSKWVQAAAARLCAPGIGMSAGSTPGDVMRLLFQGLFLAPQMVGESIKGTLLVAEVMAAEGFDCRPAPRVRRNDIIQAVQLGSRDRLLAFCRAVQKNCPVGSYIQPVAGATAGYESEVVFADGTFIDGSTSEVSCDGPLREPFVVFCQGGTHWTHWALALEGVVQALRQLK